jgi:uncharacterized SAM-binding protein YcdF (DUF218 family)
MRAFLSFIIMPLPVLYLLLIMAIIFFTIHRRKTGRFFLVMSAIWLLIISTPLVPKALVRSLENKYPQFTGDSIIKIHSSCDIIILGGGHSDDKDLSPNNQLSTAALCRLVEGIRIHRMMRGSRLILSGYKGQSVLAQSLVLYKTALLLGVDSASMAMQELPSNTRMEAEEYIRNFGRGKPLIVVTSDIHMPRAMMLFQKTGLNPIAAPTNLILRNGSNNYPWQWIPSSGNIGMMEAAIHEYAGMLWSWIGGK